MTTGVPGIMAAVRGSGRWSFTATIPSHQMQHGQGFGFVVEPIVLYAVQVRRKTQ